MQDTPMDHAQEDDDGPGLLDLLIALGEGKHMIAAVTALATAAGLAAAFLMTPVYTARTLLLPPQQQQSAAVSALANLGALAGVAGAAAGIKSPDEMYVAFLSSERLENAIIERFKLKERYDKKYLVETRKQLETNVRVASNKKSGLISIDVDDKDPAVAAQIANAFVEELRTLLGTLAVSEAQQRRQFFEQQVDKAKEQLARAESSFKLAQQRSGLQVTQALAETGIRASVELRTQIASREVQLQALRGSYATAQNPDVVRLASELAALRGQLARQEKGSPDSPGAAAPGASPTGAVEQDAVRAYRDVKVQEAMLDVLIRQYELARVDESREGPLLQQVDVASPPERKSKPRRSLIVLAAAAGGLIFGGLLVFARFLLRQAAQSAEGESRLRALRSAWGLRSKISVHGA